MKKSVCKEICKIIKESDKETRDILAEIVIDALLDDSGNEATISAKTKSHQNWQRYRV